MNLEKYLFSPIKKAVAILTLSSILAGCNSPVSSKSDNENPSSNPPIMTNSDNYNYATITREIASKNIEAIVGGSIEITDLTSYLQGTNLTIPGGALSSNTKISVGEVDNPPELPYGLNYVGSAINLEPDGINFNKEVTLKIPYTDESLRDAGISDDSNLKLYSYNKSTKVWEQINNISIQENNFITAKINHFSYYTIAGIISSPSDLGTPLPGDLLYTRGAIGGGPLFYWSWMPGHVGICVGEKVFNGVPYNVIHAVGSGVTRSYFHPISKFSGENIFMGAREPKSGTLTSQQRETIVNYIESQVGKPYAWTQTLGSAFGTLPGYLVKGPQKFNCVGLAEKAYEIAGVNKGEGLVSEKNEEKLLTPVEQFNSTRPASGKNSDSPSGTPVNPIIKNIIIQPGPEGKDAYVHYDTSSEGFGDRDYLDADNFSGWDDEALIQFPIYLSSSANIISAKLGLYGQGAFVGDNATVNIRKILSPWEESSVKWNSKPNYDSVVLSTILSDETKWHEWDITSLVQDWINGSSNYGLAVISKSHRPSGGIKYGSFYSGDNSEISKRPRLIISYQE